MPDLDILRDLIREDTLVSAVSDANGRSVLVLEEKKAEPAYAITILNVPHDIVAVKADDFPPPKFKGSRGERKRADFVIFARTPGKNWIIYIEMKGGKSRSEDVFWERGVNFLEEDDYQQRFVSVKEIGVNKRPTWERNRGERHDTPRNMQKIVAPGRGEIRFRKLIEG